MSKVKITPEENIAGINKKKVKRYLRRVEKANKNKQRSAYKGRFSGYLNIDEVPVYETRTRVVPAWKEENITWVEVKRFKEYIGLDGKKHISCSPAQIPVKEVIEHPEKTVAYSKYVGDKPCKPYVKKVDTSSKKFLKHYANKRLRGREDDVLFGAGYKKVTCLT